jgi:hypothetical protein
MSTLHASWSILVPPLKVLLSALANQKYGKLPQAPETIFSVTPLV